MTTEYATSSQPTSSAMGRKWLRGLNQSVAKNSATPEGQPEIAIVSIPDLSPQSDASRQRRGASKIEPFVLQKKATTSPDFSDPLGDSVQKRMSQGYLETLFAGNKDIQPLLEQIDEKFPVDAPHILLFSGSESNPHTSFTCASVAIDFASKNVGRILVIDSDFAESDLSHKQSLAGKAGLSNILVQGIDWRMTVFKTGVERVDFLSCGNQQVRRLQSADDALRKITSELRSEYQYIFVNVGDAHEDGACLWSDHCDGTYLIVSLNGSSQSIAKSAVSQLQNYGARLVGCIVSDSNAS